MYAVRSAARITSVSLSIGLTLGAFAAPLHAQNGKLRDAVARSREAQAQGLDDGADEMGGRFALPPNVRVERDVAYGTDPKQRFDVYIPAKASHAPVLFLVHGGGWRRGDKAARSVVENKVARWTKAGFIVISANYRLLPAADPIAQAGDLALAVSVAQRRLPTWGAIRIAWCSSATRRERTSSRCSPRTERYSASRRRGPSSGRSSSTARRSTSSS